MATNEEVIQWVRENLKLIQDSCEEEENFEEKHWKKLREIRDYVHEKLSIDTSGPIISFSKNEHRDKNDNEFLLDDILEESFDKHYEDDDKDERNFEVVRKIFDEVRNSKARNSEDRDAAWDILIWFAASSYDDVLGKSELDILGDLLKEIEELLDSDDVNEDNDDLVVKILTYFRVLFLIIVAPEDEEDVSEILGSKCLEGFLDEVEAIETVKDALGSVPIFFMRRNILQHDEELSEDEKAEKLEILEQNLPEGVQSWLDTFIKFPANESLTCLEIDFMTNVLQIFQEVYDSEKHGNIDAIINSGDVTFSEIAHRILTESELEEEILEVFFQFVYTFQSQPGFMEILEKDDGHLKNKLQECYDENDVYIGSDFIFHNESEDDSDFGDIDDVMDAIGADSDIESQSEPGSEKGSEPKVKAAEKPQKGKVMISYNWGSKTKARTLKKILIAAGFDVWIDEEGMEEDIVDSMASAVDNSDVVVICASEKYQKSKNCKSEAKFAYDNDKPVVPVMMENFQREKWLRFIMGTKLYIPFYEETLDQDQVKQFLKIVHKRVSTTKGVEEEKIAEALVENVTDKALMPLLNAGAAISDTSTAEDLEKWFQTNKISSLKEIFGSETEAGLFLQLRSMKKHSASDYYKLLREDFKLTGVSLLKFDRGIDRL